MHSAIPASAVAYAALMPVQLAITNAQYEAQVGGAAASPASARASPASPASPPPEPPELLELPAPELLPLLELLAPELLPLLDRPPLLLLLEAVPPLELLLDASTLFGVLVLSLLHADAATKAAPTPAAARVIDRVARDISRAFMGGMRSSSAAVMPDVLVGRIALRTGAWTNANRMTHLVLPFRRKP